MLSKKKSEAMDHHTNPSTFVIADYTEPEFTVSGLKYVRVEGENRIGFEVEKNEDGFHINEESPINTIKISPRIIQKKYWEVNAKDEFNYPLEVNYVNDNDGIELTAYGPDATPLPIDPTLAKLSLPDFMHRHMAIRNDNITYDILGIPSESKVKLSYESNGGTKYDDEEYDYGTEVTLDKKPTKEGYTFAGWYLDADFKNKAIDKFVLIEDVTLYAKWTRNGSSNPVDPVDPADPVDPSVSPTPTIKPLPTPSTTPTIKDNDPPKTPPTAVYNDAVSMMVLMVMAAGLAYTIHLLIKKLDA